MIKVKTIQGMDSIYAVQAFHKLMLGLKMLPSYFNETYEAFFARIDEMSESDQEKMIREALAFVKLDQDEILDLMNWALDPNGVPYSKESRTSLKPGDIHEVLTAVCKVIAKDHKINFVTEAEKKNLKISPLISEEYSTSTQISH